MKILWISWNNTLFAKGVSSSIFESWLVRRVVWLGEGWEGGREKERKVKDIEVKEGAKKRGIVATVVPWEVRRKPMRLSIAMQSALKGRSFFFGRPTRHGSPSAAKSLGRLSIYINTYNSRCMNQDIKKVRVIHGCGQWAATRT